MDSLADTVSLRRQLDRAVSAEDVERARDVLESLGGVPMTLEVLRESKVGASVAKLKKHADVGIANPAKALVKRWKRVAEASGLQGKGEDSPPAKGAKVSSSSDDAGSGSNGKTGASSKGKSGGTSSSSSFPVGARSEQPTAPASRANAMETTEDDVLTESGLAPFRLKMRRKFHENLLVGMAEGFDRVEVARVACSVEAAMNDIKPFASRKQEYMDKARELTFNMKKNHQLREDVRTGAVLAEKLVVMTSHELLPKDSRDALDKATNERTEARMLDWAEKNQDAINKQCGIKSQEGLFECGRCKSNKTTYTQKQTRSADEPMTTFVTCTNCNNRWKFC